MLMLLNCPHVAQSVFMTKQQTVVRLLYSNRLYVLVSKFVYYSLPRNFQAFR